MSEKAVREALYGALTCIENNIDAQGTEFDYPINGVTEYHQVTWWVERWRAALAASEPPAEYECSVKPWHPLRPKSGEPICKVPLAKFTAFADEIRGEAYCLEGNAQYWLGEERTETGKHHGRWLNFCAQRLREIAGRSSGAQPPYCASDSEMDWITQLDDLYAVMAHDDLPFEQRSVVWRKFLARHAEAASATAELREEQVREAVDTSWNVEAREYNRAAITRKLNALLRQPVSGEKSK